MNKLPASDSHRGSWLEDLFAGRKLWHRLLWLLFFLLLLWLLLQALFYTDQGVTMERIITLAALSFALFCASMALMIVEIRRLAKLRRARKRGLRKQKRKQAAGQNE